MQGTKFFSNFGLMLIIGVFIALSSRVLFLNPDPWWDAAVYEGMGMFMFSGGDVGIWEPSRPPVLPVLSGALWRAGLDAQWGGILIGILAGAGCIAISYRLGNAIGKKSTGTIAALFLAFSPTFFLFSQVNQTEIISLFLSLASLWFFTKRRYGISGFLSGVSILTRFFQGIFAFGLFVLVCVQVISRRENKRRIVQFVAALLIPLLAYFILNFALYGDASYPFFLQYWMIFNTGWIFHQPISYYFLGIFKENPLFLLSVIPLIGYCKALFGKKNKDTNHPSTIFFYFLILVNIAPYLFIAHKEMRFLLSLFPLLAVLAAKGATDFTQKAPGPGKWLRRGLIAIWVIITSFSLSWNTYDDRLEFFSPFLEAVPQGKTAWISNPAFALETAGRVTQLMYYPLYNTKRAGQLMDVAEMKSGDGPDFIFLNTCDVLPCPTQDTGCTQATADLISGFRKNFAHSSEAARGECEYMVFSR
ncbi:glycosyltransferase family 39 protein [Candidatus Woesearchaeota archaeon]|nr:glycosyltransferase family 39 protein [Candidatus Woesearchaeota archaeon]